MPQKTLHIFLHLFVLREREREREGEREREREKESQAGSTVSAEPDLGLDLRNSEIMTGVEIKSRTLNRLNHSGIPKTLNFDAYAVLLEMYRTGKLIF